LYEKILGRVAFIHLSVSVALGKRLRTDFGMNARRIIPLYDAAGPQFHVLSPEEKDHVFNKYRANIFDGFDRKRDRFLVVSTSYTPDEDMTVLFDAVKRYAENKSLPRIRIAVTGKGPMEAEMKAEMLKLQKELDGQVTFRTAWLPYEDYPLVIGSADLGISLHKSSSGFDLPMKVVDLFGCGVPVVALGFPALPELVKNGENGMIVYDSRALADSLKRVFTDPTTLKKLTAGAQRSARLKWDTNWTEKLGPLFGVGKYRERSGFSDTSSSDSD
jgi:beta-1,4-mannosyltransferase